MPDTSRSKTTAPGTVTLHTDFSGVSKQDWVQFAQTFLRDQSLDSLVRFTDDGIAKGPLFTKADRPETYLRQKRMSRDSANATAWLSSATVEDANLGFANQQLLADLEGGASAFRIQTKSEDNRGVTLRNGSDIKRLLQGIYTDFAPLSFAPHNLEKPFLETLLDLPDVASATVNLGYQDPRGFPHLTDVISRLPKRWTLFTLDGAGFHDRGASEAQELAILCAQFSSLLRQGDPETIAQRIIIELAADQDGHKTIAKFRAARRLLSHVLNAFGIESSRLEIHAISSRRMMQSVDPWTNFMRLTSSAFGAICGGADTLALRAFTDALGAPTPFGYRTARNIQRLLMEESHLGQVDDPAFGSYAHEALSDRIAQAAWKKFQDIERFGGIEKYTETPSGAPSPLEQDLTKSREQREARADPIVGVTLHPAKTPRPAKIRKPAS